AGKLVYRALEAAQMAVVPPLAWQHWDGAELRRLGLYPRLRKCALSNVYPACPTHNGEQFRAPSDAELRSPTNRVRIERELARARRRSNGPLDVIALGRRAAWLLERLGGERDFVLVSLGHPSAQGLLQSAPNRGRGCRLRDLEEGWQATLLATLRA